MDDCWHAPARSPRRPHPPVADPTRFPDGIKALAGSSTLFLRSHTKQLPTDKVHNLGLKIGIYSSAGTKTCAGQFGSLGYEEIDAKMYAEWGIDYLSEYYQYVSRH